MKALVTGSSGFIGIHLVKRLITKGYDVFCLVRNSSHIDPLVNLGVTFNYGDITEKKSLENCIRDVDHIYHLAAILKTPRKADFYKVNSQGTLNLLEQVAESKITLDKIVILSSLAACGPSKIGEFKKKTEDDPSTPVSDYGKSKLEAEIHAKKFMDKLPISIVRTGIVYGPGNYEFINLLKMLSLYFVLYYPGDDFTYSVIHVEDLVNGLLLCAESTKSAGEVFNISSEIPIKWIDLAMAFAKQMGKKPIMIPLPGIILKLAGVLSEIFGNLSGEFPIFNRDKVLEVLAGSWTCDISKAKHVLDYTSGISLDQGAKSFIDWYKSINIKKK